MTSEGAPFEGLPQEVAEAWRGDWSAWPKPGDEPAPPTQPLPLGRGGPQRIPRPYNARPGGPPVWAAEDPANRRLSVGDLRTAFASLGPVTLPADLAGGAGAQGSAVLAPIYDDGTGLAHVLLTRRTLQLRAHAGEVSFPGGRVEPGESPAEGACREAKEEIGLDPSTVELIGELDHLTTPASRSSIVPYVGVLPGRPDTIPNPAEVDAVLYVSLAELADPAIYRQEIWTMPDGRDRPIHFFELVGDTVWGATAAMLNQLLGIATGTLGRGVFEHDD